MGAFVIGSIAGAIGVGYFVYGKKHARTVPMVCGALLMVYPYLVGNIWLTLGIGIVLCLTPAYIRE